MWVQAESQSAIFQALLVIIFALSSPFILHISSFIRQNVVAQIILCTLAADLLTGVFHWWEDTYGRPDWPVIGQHVIRPNLVHHQDPVAMVRMTSFVCRNWQAAAALTVIGLVLFAGGRLTWQLALVCALAAVGNETHAWTHSRPQGAMARLLVEMCLVTTPQQHARHHRPPYDAYFCTLTPWLNPILERLHFWRALEAVIWSFRIRPARGTAERGGV